MSNKKNKLKSTVEQLHNVRKKAPNFSKDYAAYKKILDVYLQRANVHLTNMQEALKVFDENSKEVVTLYKELYDLVKTINPKLLNCKDSRLEKTTLEYEKLLNLLKDALRGFKIAEDLPQYPTSS